MATERPAKPLPEPTRDSKPYWDGLNEGRLLLQQCAACMKIRHYPRPVCNACYRTENLLLVPVFGPKAVEVSPPIGRLHVALDGAPWGWGNTSGEPLIIFGLPAGPHKLEITLVNPNHQPLGRSVVEFVIPPRDAAPKSR